MKSKFFDISTDKVIADGPAIKGIEIGKTAILSIEKSSDKFVVRFFFFS